LCGTWLSSYSNQSNGCHWASQQCQVTVHPGPAGSIDQIAYKYKSQVWAIVCLFALPVVHLIHQRSHVHHQQADTCRHTVLQFVQPIKESARKGWHVVFGWQCHAEAWLFCVQLGPLTTNMTLVYAPRVPAGVFLFEMVCIICIFAGPTLQF